MRSIAVVALVLVLAGCTATPQSSTQGKANGAARVFYLTNAETEIDEEANGIFPDMFLPATLVVERGDNVTIHFYNSEPADGAEHTFTLGAPYDVNVTVKPGENATISFAASKAGVFEYLCEFHQPTMRGELVVLG